MSRPPITRWDGILFQRQLNAALDDIEAGAGGGSTDPEIVRDTIATALVGGAGITVTPNDGSDTIAIASTVTGPAKGTATVTVTNNSREWSETVAATGVTGSSVVMLSIAPHDDADENDAELLDVLAMSATPGTDQITVKMAFDAPTRGAVKLNWMAA